MSFVKIKKFLIAGFFKNNTMLYSIFKDDFSYFLDNLN